MPVGGPRGRPIKIERFSSVWLATQQMRPMLQRCRLEATNTHICQSQEHVSGTHTPAQESCSHDPASTARW